MKGAIHMENLKNTVSWEEIKNKEEKKTESLPENAKQDNKKKPTKKGTGSMALPKESKGRASKKTISRNLPAKTDDNFIEPLLSSDSDEEFLTKFKRGIDIGFKKLKGGFEGCIIIGALFNQLADRKQILEQDKCSDIYEFGKKYYDMSHTVVFDYMKIAEKFGKNNPETQGYGLKEEVQNYSYSALKELYSVDEEDLEHFIGENLTIKEIRNRKKQLKEIKKGKKQDNYQAITSCEQECGIYSNEEAVNNVDPDYADSKGTDIEAEYKDLSENLLYEKEIRITQKVTDNNKALKECLNEFKKNHPEYTGNIKLAFYKCETQEET